MNIRVGFGVDVHQLAHTHELFIGGKKIDSDLGAVGHSDADVLLHAICDALLGAANLRDIGFHFSDKDPKYKGIDSKILLKEVMQILFRDEWKVVNVDCTVILEKPKLNPHIPAMKTCLAAVMQVDEDAISIKATTSEHLGFVGREEGIAAYCTALIYKV